MPPAEDLTALAEQIGGHFESLGLSRTAARVLGQLALAPEPLSAKELAGRLGVAKSSMSVALATLTRFGLVTRTPAGARGDVLQLTAGAFERVFAAKLGELEAFPALAERGLALTDDTEVRARLESIRDYYRFLMREFPLLLERWERERPAVNLSRAADSDGRIGP